MQPWTIFLLVFVGSNRSSDWQIKNKNKKKTISAKVRADTL